MNWSHVLVVAAVLALIWLLTRPRQISLNDAVGHLRNGALLIDVRTGAEFASGHLPDAINLPLDEIETELPRRVRDKSQVLLLHCQSGVRGGVAKKKLNALGYTNAFNLGSYGRAERILGAK
jgi:phage shock protein E